MYGKGKSYNDYGKGFYCTEHLELAKEWACTENTDGYANKYEIDVAGLSILNLSSDEYTILHWLALLINYRKFRISTPVMKRGADWLKEHFLIDLAPYDLVVGYRADDTFFVRRSSCDGTPENNAGNYSSKTVKCSSITLYNSVPFGF